MPHPTPAITPANFLQNELSSPKKRTLSRPWPLKRRLAQARRCRLSRPWRHATGPRTATGKSRAAQNAYTTGVHHAQTRMERREIAFFFRWHTRFLRDVRAARPLAPHHIRMHAAFRHFVTALMDLQPGAKPVESAAP